MRTAAVLSLLVLAGAAAAAEPAPAPDDKGASWYAAYHRDARQVAIAGGRTLNLYCLGRGSPTVVLESGISESSYTWWKVQGRIAKTTRVCAYDRAGMGKSPPGPAPRDTAAEVADLGALLKAAKIEGPYVLVGHSMGGYNARLFASLHGDEVAGMVLVDPSVEGQLQRIGAVSPTGAAGVKNARRFSGHCADPTLKAETFQADCVRKAPSTFPPELAADFEAMQSTAHYQAFDSEIESFIERDSPEVVAQRHAFGAMPLIVLTRTELSNNLPKAEAEAEFKVWNQLHDEVAALSSDGSNRLVQGSGHYIQIDKPDAVVDAVAEVVAKVRAKRR